MPSPKSPAIKIPELTDKSKKYDRQIRLWGEDGQTNLEAAKICLVNATVVGCEALKGLVLPGIGGFTIIDVSTVNESDLGNNFFLDASYIGQSKASACMQLLQELNPDVSGDYVDESIDYILANRPTFFDSFNIVLASNLNEHTLLQLSTLLWSANIPLVYCRSLGLFGSIRLQLKEHCVIEIHPESIQYDLRLEKPFEALRKHLEKTEVTSKVPWLLVLNKYLQVWKSKHDGHVPGNYKEKAQFCDLIKAGMTQNEENYEEAIKGVNIAFRSGLVPSNVRAIFDDSVLQHLDKKSDHFWIMAKALKDFVEGENNGYLPLSGVLPDMTASTNEYIDLQNVYRQQALLDASNVYKKCQQYLKELELPAESITERTVRLFCREAAGLTVIRGTRIADEYEKSERLQNLAEDLEVQGSLTEHYVVFRVYERFLSERGSIPGEYVVESDIARMKSIANKLLADLNVHANLIDDMLHEICNYGGTELHSISAFIGGCAAQEVIKIITKQYKPIDNTFIYNGISSGSVTIKL